ncbi:MAG: TIGR00341 family protein [Anaerolineae bacterium]|nr:TIGR00341 family protein [Anaerolineae bacterium]
MEIIEGQIPADTTWRGLFLLTSADQLGKTFDLGLALARAHNGYLLTAVFLHSAIPPELAQARQLLASARQAAGSELADYICHLIIVSVDFEADLNKLVTTAQVELVLAHLDGPVWHNLNQVPCAVAAVRGDRTNLENTASNNRLQHILMPTSGGPNTAHALQFLLRVAPRIKITALYIARSYLEPNEEALGRARLRQLLQFVDAGDRIERQVVTADTVADGILAASGDSDLVIIGATKESSIDKVLFGDIPAAVVRQSKRPVMIVRQPQARFSHWWAYLFWYMRKLLPHMDLMKRTEAYTRIRRGARPDIDFYMLISLSAIIAAFGLMSNSAAVVIGAMLVAPLMSPIVGMGMAVVLGDARFLRLTTAAVFKGALLAIGVGMLAGLLLAVMRLPLTPELLARTQPSLLDLGIALFSGLAAAYALSRSDAAGALPGVAIAAALVPPLATVGITFAAGYFWESLGALLLFVTNLVSISSATALMFLVLGFRPARNQKARRAVQMRSVQVELLSLATVIILLSVLTVELVKVQTREARIIEVTTAAVEDETIIGGSVVDLEYDFVLDDSGHELLRMDVVVRSTREVTHRQVERLQQEIGTTLQNEGIARQIALTLSVIRVTELDPLIPPTATPTPEPTPILIPDGTPTPVTAVACKLAGSGCLW